MIKMKRPSFTQTTRVGVVSFSLVIKSYTASVIICCGDVLVLDILKKMTPS